LKYGTCKYHQSAVGELKTPSISTQVTNEFLKYRFLFKNKI
jgi:hypothetical protein